MSTARPLPVECGRLAAGLRELKDRTGLSLAALGGRTPYSKSSWERYLNGKKLPPRQAVEALCALAHEPPGRLLALWELAEQAWSGRSASPGPGPGVAEEVPGPGAGDAAGPDPSGSASGGGGGLRRLLGRRSGAAYVVSGVVAVAAAVATALLLTSGERASGERAPGGQGPDRPAATSPYAQRWEPACEGEQCDGEKAKDMGCDVPSPTVVAQRLGADGQRVELRYGESCGTVWVRAWHLRLGDRVELSVPGADVKRLEAASRQDTMDYLVTGMSVAKDPRTARVCLLPAGDGRPECFTPPPSGG
ncbi:XRE family transcriptional regulator [Streptomyces sp. SCA3-4]|uniref:helix-turn-helix domain-containing protein n=1 Tax=Streptomyces sichuanensis TaxID=2871810 RepID=UPI001CE34813|nr:XRE family transcriptional regulator [Streptomyces sichuanensis]MCA6092965.1 XRE family transcriptional regulator [Streptomyces sichuanensis]